MMQTASHQMVEQFEHSLTITRLASADILQLLKIHVAEGKDPRWFLQQLEQARLNLGGWAQVAKRLNLNDGELSEFTLRLRHLQQRVPEYERGQNVNENQHIAALRFLATLEMLREKQPLLTYDTRLNEDSDEQQQQAQRQLRALECTMKALVAQAWPDALGLNNHLKLQFGADKVRRWLAESQSGDILSGMPFSELALLLIDKKEFSRHYATLFNAGSSLTYMVDPRITLQTFLEHCRQLHNTLANGERLTPAGMALLSAYGQQISAPVQRAFEQGRARVNPASFLTVDNDELAQYWQQATEDPSPLRDNIEQPRRQPKRTPEQRDQLISSLLWGVVGAVVLVMMGVAVWLFSTLPDAPPPERVQVAEAPAAPERDTPSPREKLSQMGVTWDPLSLRAAIDRNDGKVTQLFLQGGMNWQLAWTEQALAANSEMVLGLLLNYSLQMDEPKPCRRFITTVSHALSSGEAMTSLRKSYLQRFCTSPVVVEHQQHSLEQAQQRYQAEPNAQNKKWLRIQQDIGAALR